MIWPQASQAQVEKYMDRLELQNGSVLWGITEIQGDQVVMYLSPSDTISLPKSMIRSLKTQKLNPAFYMVKTPGPFYQVSWGTLIGKSHSQSINQATFSISALGGYKFNSRWSAGLGAGSYYYPQMGILPMFGEVQGDLAESRLTPIYFFRGGWSWAFQRKDNGFAIDDMQGGMFLEPGVGLKWHRAGYALQLKVSYVRQNSKTFFEPLDFGNGTIITNVEKRTFERINLSMGVSF